MIKTALNAMSRKGYRRLDLAHRMFNHAEDSLNSQSTDRAFPKTTQRRLDGAKRNLAEQRHDLLHPKGRNSDTLHGLTIRGNRRKDYVSPSLARKASGLHGSIEKSSIKRHDVSTENNSGFNKIYERYNHAIDDENHPDHKNFRKEYEDHTHRINKMYKKIKIKKRENIKDFDSHEDSHLYRPETFDRLSSSKIKNHIKSRGYGDTGKIKFKKRGININSSSLKNDRQMNIVKDTINSAVSRIRKR